MNKTFEAGYRLQSADFRIVDPLADGSCWDGLIAKNPGGSVFHTSAWIRVLCQTYGYRPLCLMQEGAQPALLPIVEVDSIITGRRGICLPFTDSCSALTSTDSDITKLWNSALEVGRERGWRTFELRDYAEGRGFDPSLQFYNHILNLAGGPSKIFDSLNSSVRRALRKAEKSGVKVEIEKSESAMEVYYDLHCLTRQKHGLPPQPYTFFENILKWIIKPGLGFLVIARSSGKPIAGAVFFHFKGKAIYKFGASDPVAEGMRPNNFVMWRGINELCSAHCETLDFGRTSLDNTGLRRYKMSWGAIECVKSYVKWNFSKSAFVSDRDNAAGWHTGLFRLLPRDLSKLIGRLLYPHIA